MTPLPQKFDLSGRTAVVTGAAGLLGKEFCHTLVEAGANLVAADLNVYALTELVDSLQASGGQAQPVETDIRQPDSVKAMVAATVKAFGRLDILVNSAALDPKFEPGHGQVFAYTFEDYPLDAWRRTIDINLTGMFLCCQAAVVPMQEQGQGVIVNLCSIYGLVGPDQRIYSNSPAVQEGQPRFKPADYAVTKAGVLGLTRYLATYYAGRNIRANALTPGGIYNNNDDAFIQAYSARTVMGRMANKDEMNGALLFLASDASSYMTGANLVVDGGWTAW